MKQLETLVSETADKQELLDVMADLVRSVCGRGERIEAQEPASIAAIRLLEKHGRVYIETESEWLADPETGQKAGEYVDAVWGRRQAGAGAEEEADA